MDASPPPPRPPRLDSVDFLRGAIIMIMALDHVRDFFCFVRHSKLPLEFVDPISMAHSTPALFLTRWITHFSAPAFVFLQPKVPLEFVDPVSMAHTTPALFFTRWITHFCAPVFVFLAGTGAYLSGTRGRTKPQLAWFLFTRGVWCMFLELVVIRASWWFNFDPYDLGAGVFWPLGWGMVLLSVLIFLPISMIAVFGVFVCCLHNLLDGLTAAQVGLPEGLWNILHSFGRTKILLPEPLWRVTHDIAGKIVFKDHINFETAYFLIPWVAVMALGYCFGALLRLPTPARRWELLGLGLGLIFAFVFIRWTNGYGDQMKWAVQKDDLYTFMSFLNCTKYPPSLMYLLMTLGPAILFLALFDGVRGKLAGIVITYGRVPLFFYLLHIPLIHGGAILLDLYRYGWSPLAWHGNWEIVPTKVPGDYGVSLGMTYAVWVIVLVILYPLCRWFGDLKRRHPHGLLSYL